MRALCCAVLFAVALPAQAEEKRSPDAKPSAELYDVKWKIAAGGELLIAPDPSRGAMDFGPMFQDLPHVWNYVRHMGQARFLMALGGNQDALSLCMADYHFRKFGLATDEMSLRQRLLVSQDDKKGKAWRSHSPLLRMLALRHLERRDVRSAAAELRALAKGGPVLMAWAARDVLKRWNMKLAGKEIRRTAPQEVARWPAIAAAVPAAPDLVLTVDQARIPGGWRAIPALRMAGMRTSQWKIRFAGGVVRPPLLAGAQMLADCVSAVPYEFCRAAGNYRMARATLAVRFTKDTLAWVWLRLDGWCDPVGMGKALVQLGWKKVDDGVLQRGDWRVALGQTQCVISLGQVAAAPKKVPDWADAVRGQLVWGRLFRPVDGRAVVDDLPILAKLPVFGPWTLTGQFNDGRLQLRAVLAKPALASRLVSRVGEGLKFVEEQAKKRSVADRLMAKLLGDSVAVSAKGKEVSGTIRLPEGVSWRSLERKLARIE